MFLLVCAVILLRPSTFWALKGLCSKECKNSIFGRYLSLLTTCGSFSNTAAEHLTVGHTHEDVGISRMNWQWFPIVFSSLLGILQNTSEVVHTLPVPMN